MLRFTGLSALKWLTVHQPLHQCFLVFAAGQVSARPGCNINTFVPSYYM